MEKLSNIHPGEVLREEFLLPLEISAERLAMETQLSIGFINELILEKQQINLLMADRLSYFFGNSTKFWLGLQYDFNAYSQL